MSSSVAQDTSPSIGAAPPGSGRSKTPGSVAGETILWLAIALFVFAVAIVPLLHTIDSAFYKETPFGLDEVRSLEAVLNVYASSRYLRMLGSALLLAALVTVLALVAGVLMAFLVARTDMPGRGGFDVLIVVPMFLSPFTGLIAWMVLGSERTGFINVAIINFLKQFGIVSTPWIDVWTFGGVVWVMALFYAPYAYLFTVNNLRAMDSSLEEAARMSGASAFQSVLRITLPMMLPSFFAAGLLIFVLSAETYTIPGIVGSTAGFTTLPWQIYHDSTVAPLHRAHAAAGGTMLLWVTIGGIILQRRMTRVAERFVTIGGKGRRSRPLELGRWRWPAFGLVGSYVLCSVILPLAALLVYSLMKFSSVRFTADLFTIKHYIDLFALPNTREAFANTLLLGVLAGSLCLLIGSIISHAELRRNSKLTVLVAFIGVLPVAVPGIVYGIGLMWTYLRTPIYGTIWVLLLAYLAKFTPYAILLTRTGILQINRELEECARACGASGLQTLRLVTMPILKPVMIAVFFFVMLQSIKELSASALLASERGPVLSVLTWSYMESGSFQFAAAVGLLQSLIMVGVLVATRTIFGIRLERAGKH
jgi:iron(III) transport system permease protein